MDAELLAWSDKVAIFLLGVLGFVIIRAIALRAARSAKGTAAIFALGGIGALFVWLGLPVCGVPLFLFFVLALAIVLASRRKREPEDADAEEVEE